MISLEDLLTLRNELKQDIAYCQKTQASQTEKALKKQLAIVELAIIGLGKNDVR